MSIVSSLARSSCLALGIASLTISSTAEAQRGRAPPQNAPTPQTPTQNRTVGPRQSGGDDDQQVQVQQRAEPSAAPPADPLEMSPDVKARIGSDWDSGYAAPNPDSALHYRRFEAPFYVERHGDYRFRLLPPFVLEHTRGLADPSSPPLEGIPSKEDTEGLYGLLYYRRRSADVDADVVFPLAWRLRERNNHVLVLGPVVHREAPGENDNWLAPLVFAGSRADGGYFHSPALLTTSHWGAKGAFTLAGPYFRDRTGTDVDAGVAPFYFHGDNGNVDGNRRTYTLIPPLLYYHRKRELEGTERTVVGPVIIESTPKRDILDVAPLFFHIKGKPESGGIQEEHTTLFPFFHWGHSQEKSLFVVPGYLRRSTRTSDTMITPFFSHAETRNGSTSLTAVGPLLPIFMSYSDKDIGLKAFGIAPFYYQSDSPAGHDFLTPLFGKFETYGVSKTYWAFPSITVTTDTKGWETDIHPIVYVGRDKESSHTVLAPFFWDFANPKKRTTVAFPVYWRFADAGDDSVTQVAGNTLYMQKRVAGGMDWQFHFLPVFSYGETPQGSWWNLFFGLAGYDGSAAQKRIKAFWLPIDIGNPQPPATGAPLPVAAPPPAKAASAGTRGAF